MENTARQARIVFTITLLLAVPLGFLAKTWIGVFYGAEFQASGGAFSILLLGCVPFTICIILAGALAGMNRQGVNLAASSLGLGVTIALDVLLIPSFGISGAALASVLSYLVTTVVVVWIFSRIGSMPALDSVLLSRGDLRYLIDGFKSVLR